MKNKDKYDLNALEIKWAPQTAKRRFFTIKLKSDDSTIFSREMTPAETGTRAYNAWLEEEYDPKILTDKEKAYLTAVAKPFRGDIKYIEKRFFVLNSEYIMICFRNNETLSFPTFKTGKMYKGMEAKKCYNLEELGL